VTNFPLRAGNPAAVDEPTSVPALFRPIALKLDRLSDVQLAFTISAILFVLCAWPIALVEVPPLQDLPNHLAAITVIENPDKYPEFVFNGFLKTNGALFAWLHVIGRAVGFTLAARLFTWLILAANALVLPRLVLDITGSRKRMVVASLFMWPFIHNWFVSMGMLDFALGVPLSFFSLLLLEHQRKSWSWLRALGIAVVCVLTWYAHVFTLMVAHMLVGIQILTRATWKERFRELRLLVPMIPGTLLVLTSLYSHMTEPTGAMHGYVQLGMQIPPWELGYNLWAEWLWGFTKLSITSILVALVLSVFLYRGRHEKLPFFGPWQLLALIGMYMAMPYIATNWFHVNSRMIGYIWVAALLRAPERIDRRLVAVTLASALLYSVGMGIDYVRLDHDRQKVTAGMSAVPEGSRMLPLLFHRQLTSENTRSLLHAWGFYVMERHTSAPLLFAHSRSFPVMYREPPPMRFNHLELESFSPSMGTPEWMCNTLRHGGVVIDCDAEWKQAWHDFWVDATPRFDHVLMWDPTADVVAQVPSAYRPVFKQDRLTIYERVDASGKPY
jgi:hypothetical protein